MEHRHIHVKDDEWGVAVIHSQVYGWPKFFKMFLDHIVGICERISVGLGESLARL